jgi:uncharacterized protein YjaG (DUF416 family)
MHIEALNKLKQLDFSKQAAFAYLICERLYPNYVDFSNKYGFGEPIILRNAINYLYNNLFESNIDKINFFLKEVDKNTPDTEDFETVMVSPALDACTAIQDCLYFLVDNNFSRIINISTYAADTISVFIQEKESIDFVTDEKFQQKINHHPLMQKEVAMQIGTISYLEKISSLLPIDIDTLRHL